MNLWHFAFVRVSNAFLRENNPWNVTVTQGETNVPQSFFWNNEKASQRRPQLVYRVLSQATTHFSYFIKQEGSTIYFYTCRLFWNNNAHSFNEMSASGY